MRFFIVDVFKESFLPLSFFFCSKKQRTICLLIHCLLLHSTLHCVKYIYAPKWTITFVLSVRKKNAEWKTSENSCHIFRHILHANWNVNFSAYFFYNACKLFFWFFVFRYMSMSICDIESPKSFHPTFFKSFFLSFKLIWGETTTKTKQKNFISGTQQRVWQCILIEYMCSSSNCGHRMTTHVKQQTNR